MGNIPSQIKMDEFFKPTNLIIFALTLYGVQVVRRIVQVRTAIAGIGHLPGDRLVYGPYSIMSRILPSIRYVNRAGKWLFEHKYSCE